MSREQVQIHQHNAAQSNCAWHPRRFLSLPVPGAAYNTKGAASRPPIRGFETPATMLLGFGPRSVRTAGVGEVTPT